MHKFLLISVATMAMLSLLVFSRTLSIIPNCSSTPSLSLFQFYEALTFCLIRLMQIQR